MDEYKAQITLNGKFPQEGILTESCQFACPWKKRNPVTGEWHCTVYDNISDCKK